MTKLYKNILIIVAGFSALHLIFGGRLFLIVAVLVLFISAISPKAAVVIDKVWLFIGDRLGNINSAILLFIIYYLLLTPIAFLSRVGSKDPLQLKAPSKTNFKEQNRLYSAKDLQNPW